MNLDTIKNVVKRKIEKIKSLRLYLLKQVSNLTVQQYNHIPVGHNNNIDEAVDYLLYHEGYHAGCITAFKPIV